MRLVLSWLRQFVDVQASAEDIADTMSIRGFETSAIEAIGGGDAVIDFEITANRPDCLSVLGLAREIATAYDRPLRDRRELATLPTGQSDRVTVRLDDEDLCPRYAAAVVEVSVAASPAWMAERLQAAGVRPISTIVDVTNYVSLEMGQPMHAFDLARLGGSEIRIRRARPAETITTLDGIHRKLDPDMLVIADRDRAQAIAGVMGGAASEVSAATTSIVLESAYFKPASVRHTSKKLALKTEASARFERGADIGAQVAAIQRAAALITKIGTGRPVGPIIDCYPRPRRGAHVALRRARLARLFGVEVPDRDVERILQALGLELSSTPDGWTAVAPTFRVDLLREADLIEEVGRHYGFDRLEPTFPAVTGPAPAPDPRVPRDELVRRVLTAAGASEAVTFGFIEARAAELFVVPDAPAPISVANPLSAKFDTLRPSLLPGLVDAVAHNRRHGRRDIRLFEIGTRFASTGETRALGIVLTGNAGDDHWSASVRDVDFFDVKGVCERICEALGVGVRVESTRQPFLAAGQAGSVVVTDGRSNGAALGVIGQLAPAVADARGLPRQDRVFVVELDLDAIAAAKPVRSDATRPLPRYPFVVRDVSIVVANVLPAEIIRGTIQAAARSGPAPLVASTFFDRYQGQGVPEGSISLSLRLVFQADDRTLTDAEVQQSFDTILAALVKQHGAVQR